MFHLKVAGKILFLFEVGYVSSKDGILNDFSFHEFTWIYHVNSKLYKEMHPRSNR